MDMKDFEPVWGEYPQLEEWLSFARGRLEDVIKEKQAFIELYDRLKDRLYSLSPEELRGDPNNCLAWLEEQSQRVSALSVEVRKRGDKIRELELTVTQLEKDAITAHWAIFKLQKERDSGYTSLIQQLNSTKSQVYRHQKDKESLRDSLVELENENKLLATDNERLHINLEATVGRLEDENEELKKGQEVLENEIWYMNNRRKEAEEENKLFRSTLQSIHSIFESLMGSSKRHGVDMWLVPSVHIMSVQRILNALGQNYGVKNVHTKDVPKPVRRVGILTAIPEQNYLMFNSDNEAAEQLKVFGTVTHYPKENCYVLGVDPRFDFHQILEHIDYMNDRMTY
jgi:hypothetical protein